MQDGTATDREQDGNAPFGALIETSDPELYRLNAFRIMGLAVDATPRDITRQTEKLKMVEKFKSAVCIGGALPLDPTPDADTMRMALQRLRDPERRLIDEFFWFWPHKLGNSKTDEALESLTRGEVKKAERIWIDQENQHSEANVSMHNLSILSHTTALDLEYKSSREQLSEEEARLRDLHWKEAIKRWKILLNHEAFWSRLTARIRELDDPRLTTGAARRLRSSLPLSVLLINAQLALRAAEQSKTSEVKRQLEIMRNWQQSDGATESDVRDSSPRCSICGSHVDKDQRKGRWWCAACAKHVEVNSPREKSDVVLPHLVEEALNHAVKPLRERIKMFCKVANEESDADATKANKVAKRLFVHTQPLLRVLDCLFPAGNLMRDGAHDEVALCALGCQVVYGNKTNDWKTSLDLLEYIEKIAAGESARLRIGRNLEIVRNNYENSLCWFCEENEADDKSAVEVKMYGDIQRTPTYQGIRTTWRYFTVRVPRCARCKKGQTEIDSSKTLGGLAGLILGLAIWIFGKMEFDGFILVVMLTTIGGFLGYAIAKGDVPEGMKPESSKKDFKSVKELLSQGWAFGEKPPNVN